MKNSFLKWKSIQIKEKRAPTIKKDIMFEVKVKEEVKVVVMNDSGNSTITTPIMKEKKAQLEDE